jgi:dTDP-4-amino-4,6-dideoxy-D-galactose acyltransferase
MNVTFLDWDSEFFSRRIARIDDAALTADSLPLIDSWCDTNRIECLYYLATPADSRSIRTAGSNGFDLVDLRITLDLKITPSTGEWRTGSPLVRMSKPEDIPRLRSISAVNHRDSRFYSDGRFTMELCDELFATWVERSCNGYADAVMVADKGDGAAGYTSCHLKGNGVGNIGLVGVSSCCHGEGLGKLLIAEALGWFAANDVHLVTVVTQGVNIGAQRFYQKSGFMTSSIGLWFHKWYNQN